MRQATQTIWESASRPLFVRSVWLERIGDTGRRQHRHFILDYEPRERQRQRWIGAAAATAAAGGGNQQKEQWEQQQEQTLDESLEYSLEEYLLLDATKLTLQYQSTNGLAAKANVANQTTRYPSCRHAKRRAWLNSRSYQQEQLADQHASFHSHSRRSSLSAMGSTAGSNNPEERLAERVLNWLDLAGRADIVKSATPATPPAGNSSSNNSAQHNRSTRSSRHRQRSCQLKRVASTQRVVPRKQLSKPQPQPSAVGCCNNANANAKPITIIFNKEGVPVRLNRPARNIDLCALSSSASTTRRLAGQLASARLYNGAASSTPTMEEVRSTPPHSSRSNKEQQQQQQQQQQQLDSRKQLHIFMPSLPKKGLLLGAMHGDDALSVSFSDLCQV